MVLGKKKKKKRAHISETLTLDIGFHWGDQFTGGVSKRDRATQGARPGVPRDPLILKLAEWDPPVWGFISVKGHVFRLYAPRHAAPGLVAHVIEGWSCPTVPPGAFWERRGRWWRLRQDRAGRTGARRTGPA